MFVDRPRARAVELSSAASTSSPGATARSSTIEIVLLLGEPPVADEDTARLILEHLTLGVLLCDTALDRLLFANAEAQLLLRALTPAPSSQVPAPLQRALVAALGRDAQTGALSPAVPCALPNGRRLFVRCKGLGARGVLATLTAEVLREADLYERLRARTRLSWREFRLITLVRGGCSDEEIAGRLAVSALTVKQYLARICKSFGVGSRSELVAVVELAAQE